MAAGLGCGTTFIKYLLFFFNFLFAICGLLLVILGALALNATAPLSQIGNHLGSSAVVLLAVGVIIFVIAFYGCCGAVRESNCMLVTFAVLLLALIVVEVVACVMAFMYSGQAEDEMNKGISKVFEEARQGDDKLAVEAVDFFQEKLQCCGEDGPKFWAKESLRSSCCGGQSGCTSVMAYQKGCKREIKEFVYKNGKLVGGVAIGVAVVELLGVWFALGLAGAIKKAERSNRY